jgi:3-deoxy-D-manno-octulosonic acid kinase
VVRTGGWRYRGDILTARVPGRPLNDQLRGKRPDPGSWRLAGTWIRSFHDAGVDHADLHGGNILVAEGSVHLIDFDRARLRGPRGRWRLRNLARFQRSVRKILGPAWREDPAWRECWEALEAGYAAGPSTSGS